MLHIRLNKIIYKDKKIIFCLYELPNLLNSCLILIDKFKTYQSILWYSDNTNGIILITVSFSSIYLLYLSLNDLQ